MEYTRNQNSNQHYKGPLFQKLAQVKETMKYSTRNSGFMEPERSPMLWIADGVDHINISNNAETELGEVLTHSSPVSFEHSIFGRFVTMEAFWHYIQSEERDDRICNMVGRTLTQFSKKLTHHLVRNFRAIIVDSNWQRIKQHPVIAEEMRNSTLPFDCWFIDKNTGLRRRPIYFKWLVSGFEEIRKALKEDREPDFEYLKEVPGSDIYEFAIPKGFAAIVKNKQQVSKENKGPSLINRAHAAAKKKHNEDRHANKKQSEKMLSVVPTVTVEATVPLTLVASEEVKDIVVEVTENTTEVTAVILDSGLIRIQVDTTLNSSSTSAGQVEDSK